MLSLWFNYAAQRVVLSLHFLRNNDRLQLTWAAS